MKKYTAFLITLLIFLLFGVVLFSVVQKSDRFGQGYAPVNSKHTVTINMSDGANDFYRSQISAPGDYFASSDSMLDSYRTQGGMAPPRLILMKGYQVTNNETYYKEVTDNPTHECIAIWTTGGFSSIDDWSTGIMQLLSGKVEETARVKVGERTATMRKKTVNNRSIYEAYVQVSEKDGGVSYYLNTCNDQNKKDFLSVLQSLKIRADIDF